MMGTHHAVTGAAAWIALTSTLNSIPALGWMPLTPAEVALGAVVTAGAALLPDADHPSATISYSVPWVGKMVTGLVNSAAGGHRHGTHSGLSAIIVIALAVLAGVAGVVDTSAGSPYVLIAGGVAAALLAFSLKVLKVVRSWGVAWLSGIVIAVAVTHFAPEQWVWLPASVAVGWVVHMMGDFLTTGGLPLLWPKNPRPPKSWQENQFALRFWSKGGYFALPILGNTGSWREWALCAPLWLYAIYGVGVSAAAALPGMSIA